MRRLWLRLALLLLLTSLSTACASPPPALPLRAEQSFAWLATSPQAGEGRLFLMGSMHMGVAPMELGPVLRDAFDRSDALVMEIDPDSIGVIEILRLTAEYAQLPVGVSLAQQVSPETWAALVAWCDRGGERLSNYEPLKAWFVAIVVEAKEYERLGYRAEYGAEEQFSRRAKRQRKRIEQLETPGEQMALLASASDAVQDHMLAAALERDDEALTRLLDIYRSGDADGMDEFLMQDAAEPGGSEILERMIFGRNETMVQRLLERAGDGLDRFVLVGAAHMAGDRGMPSLLQQQGWTVQRVGARGAP